MIALIDLKVFGILVFVAAVFAGSAEQTVFAQELPDKIRGYKVHKAKIIVKTEGTEEKNGSAEALVKIGDPQLVKVSLTGIMFELSGSISSADQSGTVDFLTFHDFRVNGLNVDIAEYQHSFEFKKNEPVELPKPFEIFLSTPSAAKGLLNEVRDSRPKWRVTGRVFVFGKFKKSIFKFKRVVPVDIDILIANPLKNEKIESRELTFDPSKN